MFWFKPKEIVVDCFTFEPLCFEYAKPDFSYKFFPEWFEATPKIINGNTPTIKACRAFKRYYAVGGIVVPFPYNIDIDVSDENKKECNVHINGPKIFGAHPKEQVDSLFPKNYEALKLSVPWRLKTKEFVEFLWTDTIWNKERALDYSGMPGIVDFKNQFDIMYNFMVEYGTKPKKISFILGEPAFMLTPLTDKKIVLKHHLVSKEEYYKYDGFTDIKGWGKYEAKKNIIRNKERRDSISKCPFNLRK
jgi:hypothetical protein